MCKYPIFDGNSNRLSLHCCLHLDRVPRPIPTSNSLWRSQPRTLIRLKIRELHLMEQEGGVLIGTILINSMITIIDVLANHKFHFPISTDITNFTGC